MATLFEQPKRGRKDPDDALYLSQLETPSKGRRIISDTHKDAPRGFGLRVTAKGSRSFILRYTSPDGRDRLLTVGEHGTWSLAAARAEANTKRREIDSGADPIQQRRDRQAESTVADVTERYCRARVDHLATARKVRAMLKRHLLAEMGQRKITAVRRADVIELVERIASKHPREAGKVLAYVKQVFEFAEDREIIENNPVGTLKASKIGSGLTARKRARVLSDAEIKALWNHADTCGPSAALALRLILLTGQRPGEVLGMRRDEIDGDVWVIPADRRRKTDDTHRVPLTDTARELIDSTDGEYVISARQGVPLSVSGLAKAVKANADALGNQSGPEGLWRPHDLRRTMRTRLAELGITETVAETTIGHVRKGIAGVYDRHSYDHEKRQALESWQRRLLSIAHGEAADDETVVRLKGAAR